MRVSCAEIVRRVVVETIDPSVKVMEISAMRVHLIGTNHCYQLRGYKETNWKAFLKYLLAFCQNEAVDLIAEELNEWEIASWKDQGATGSVAREVASRLGIKHLFCDPDEADRERRGIQSRQELADSIGAGGHFRTAAQAATICRLIRERSWPIREDFWLEKLQQTDFSHCAFILGANHVVSFKKLLTSNGFDARVESGDWEP